MHAICVRSPNLLALGRDARGARWWPPATGPAVTCPQPSRGWRRQRRCAAHAQWHGGVRGGFYGGGPGVHPGWYGGGRWEHGWHGGNFGWWYINAGIWTMYPYYYPYYPYAPYYAYPYPAPYPYTYGPDPALNSNGNLPAPPPSWYYCDAARGYYPHVPVCPGGWRAVPATPPAGAAAGVAPEPAAPPAPPPPGAPAPAPR